MSSLDRAALVEQSRFGQQRRDERKRCRGRGHEEAPAAGSGREAQLGEAGIAQPLLLQQVQQAGWRCRGRGSVTIGDQGLHGL